jgi:Ca2+-binding RTX toxin-like protein
MRRHRAQVSKLVRGDVMPFNVNWATVGANGTYSLANGADTVGLTVSTTTNINGQTARAFSSGTPSAPALWVNGINEPITTTMTFAAPVSNFSFQIYDIDQRIGGWDDKLTVLVTDAQGNVQAVNFGDLSADPYHSQDGNVLNSDGNASTGVETINAADSVRISIAGPVSRIQFVFDNGESFVNSGTFGVGNMTFDRAPLDYVIEGTAGADMINDAYVLDPDGDRVNGNDALNGSNDDVIFGYAGNDSITAGAGNDSIEAGDDNDTVNGGTGNDTIFGGAGVDSLFGNDGADLMYGGASADYVDGDGGNDTIYGDAGNDTLVGDAGNDTLVGDAGNDQLFGGIGNDQISASSGNNLADGGDGNDQISMGTGNDTLIGGAGNDAMTGAGGDDRFVLQNAFGNDTITGGENGEALGDTLDLSAVTTGLTVNLTNANPETGTVSDGTFTAAFAEIETIVLGAGVDTIVLANGSGADRVTGFAAPINNGDGTFTGVDQLNVAGLNDANGNPVNVFDVVVTGSGNNVVLTFPNGESFTLVQVDIAAVSSPLQLAAMGIPVSDGIVYGSVGGDVIDAAYLGDNDGDRIDANDAVLAGAAPNDDYVIAGAGNDTVDAGAGDDFVVGDFATDNDNAVRGDAVAGPGGDDVLFGGAGDDTLWGGSGDDSLYGGDGNDSLLGGHGDDLLQGGAGDDYLEGLFGDDTIFGGDGDDVVFGRDGADLIYGGDGADNLVGSIGIDTIYGGAGNDILAGSQGSDLIYGGEGNDVVFIGVPAAGDIAYDNEGTVYLDEGDDFLDAADATLKFTAFGGDGNDLINAGVGADTLFGGAGDDQIHAGAGDDQIYGGAGADYMEGQGGDDTFHLSDGAGFKIIVGGETDEVNGDTLDASAVTSNIYLDLNSSDPESGGLTVDPTGGVAASPAVHYVRLFRPDAPVGGFGVYPTGPIDFSAGEWFYVPVSDFDTTLDDSQGVGGSGGAVDTSQTLINGFDGLSVGGASLGAAGRAEYLDANGNPFFVGWVSSDYAGPTGIAGDTYLIVTDAAGAEPGGVATATGLQDANGQFDYSSFTAPFQSVEFSEIETIILGSGNDYVTGSDGDDRVFTGAGSDTINGGAGDDTFDLGAADGARDTLLLADGFGNDTVSGFEAPIDNGDGTFTGQDVLDVSVLTSDGGYTPVNTSNVVVTDTNGDGTGDAILTFPSGDSVTLVGVSPSEVDSAAKLEAIGIPRPGPVDGTAAGDAMGVGFVDDQGDIIDGVDGLDDLINGNDGDDTINAGFGTDTVYGGAGDDLFVLTDGFGLDQFIGGEDGEGGGDALDASALTTASVLDLSAGDAASGEDGTLSSGTNIATFSEVETIVLGAGADSVIGSSGDDNVRSGAGADTLDGGAGNDTFDLGADGDADVVRLSDGGGQDTLSGFEAPINNGDGTFTGVDQLDVSGLNAMPGIVVTVLDVVVSDDGAGNAVLTFPNGEALTLIGADPLVANNPAYLTALGIPDVTRDYTVDGTAGADTIDAAYLDDPQGDRIDATDNQIGNNDDVVLAGAGNDNVNAGAGNDTVSGEAGNDTLNGGVGADVLYGGDGADVLVVSGTLEADTLTGGEGGTDFDTIEMEGLTSGVDVLYIGNETGRITTAATGPTITLFTEVEALNLTELADSVSGGASSVGLTIAAGASNDTILGGSGADSVRGEAGDDWLSGGAGNDTLRGDAGDDTIYGGAGKDSLFGGEGNDRVFGEDGDDFINTRTSVGLGLPDQGYPGIYGADTDPNNDRDSVEGGAGNDTILTGDDNDEIFGGGGADSIDAGFDDDIVFGGSGNDTVIGGEGNDSIIGGDGDDVLYGGLTPGDLDISSVPDVTDLLPFNGLDTILGGAGNDLIYGMDDADLLYGDAGNDTIFGGIDNDSLFGGDGADSLYGDDGDDYIEAGAGDDAVYGGDGNDTIIGGGTGSDALFGDAGNDSITASQTAGTLVYGGSGDDTITGSDLVDILDAGTGNDVVYGNAGADIISGDAGNDALFGGDGADQMSGGVGADTLTGGAGADTLFGDDDRDLFFGGIGDLIDGGNGGDDFDTLDLRDLGGRAFTNVIYGGGDGESGIVQVLDGSGAVTGTFKFADIERIIPCFTPGTLVVTQQGERAVETLVPGDRVLTRDSGYQTLRWVGMRTLDANELAATPAFQPVRLLAGALGTDMPHQDMTVSPQHRFLISGARAEILFGEHEVLVLALHLVNDCSVLRVTVPKITYIHLMFDQHEIIYADGLWTESFQPGDMTLASMDSAQRAEVFALFPALETGAAYPSARLALRGYEAKALLGA